MKRSLSLIFAALMLTSCLAMPISAIVSEEEACCAEYSGTSTRIIDHPDRGGPGGSYG